MKYHSLIVGLALFFLHLTGSWKHRSTVEKGFGLSDSYENSQFSGKCDIFKPAVWVLWVDMNATLYLI